MKKTASIIIPTFNRSEVLPNALDSALRQHYRPIEIIVVDDGSSDETSSLVSSWKEEHSDVSCTLHYVYKENSGPAASRNKGLELASGSYVYFLDSDDHMYPNLIDEAVTEMERKKAACTIFGFEFSAPGQQTGVYQPPENVEPLHAYLSGKLWGYTSCILYERELVNSVGYWNEQLKTAEDYEFLGRALFLSQKTAVLHSPMLNISRGRPSLGSLKDTEKGLQDRLTAEQTIVDLVNARHDIPETVLSTYANRLIKTAINYSARKEHGFAKKLGLLARQIGFAPGSSLDRIKRLVWRAGWPTSVFWVKGIEIISRFRKYAQTFRV